jgi:putative transposase
MSVANTGSACASGAVTNEPECVATAIKAWLSVSHTGPVYIEPGKSWHNGAAERCIGKFHDECLHMEWFLSRKEAQIIIESYRRQYNASAPTAV